MNEKIISFLKRNPSLNLSGLEKEANLPARTLSKAINKHQSIPKRYQADILEILRRYGYQEQEGARVIAIVNNKGGVAKTTITANLGRGLHLRGKKVLLIDMDVQGNLTYMHNIALEANIELYRCLIEGEYHLPIQECIYEVIEGEEGFDILPSTIALGAAERELPGRHARGMVRLREELKEIQAEYDYILIDCPPSLNILSANAIIAADSVLVPVQPEDMAVVGLRNVLNFIEDQKIINSKIQVEGLLFSLVKKNTKLHTEYMSNLRDGLAQYRVFDTTLVHRVQVPEATANKVSVFDYQPAKQAAQDFNNLIEELL